LSRKFSLPVTFRPRLLDCLPGYSKADFSADFGAGLTVALVALPLAMAFAIASGVRPEAGIVTAIVGGFIVSLLGGSRVQIAGPAGAFVAILYGITEKYGVANLLIATIMAGVLLFAMGAFKLGTLVRFIPVSIVIGFTNGIAVIIALQQVKDFFGLAIEKMPSNFFSQLAAIGEAAGTANAIAAAIGVASILVIVAWPVSYKPNAGRFARIASKLPSTVIVLAVSAAVVSVFHLPVETIGSRFGQLPSGLPMPAMPVFNWETAQNLVGPTIAIALLGAIESLLCARVADGLIGDRHDPNQELMAQGVANFITPFFGGIAVTGTIARTVTNVRTGGRTPIAGIVHALALLLVIMVAAPLASKIPLAALAAILVWVAWNMGEWREFLRIRQFSMIYKATLLSTFFLTVVFDLVVAVEVGLVLSSLFFIYRMSSLTKIEPIDLPHPVARLADGRRVEAHSLFGSFFFGSVTKLENLVNPKGSVPDVLVLEMHQVINMDTTGLDALESLHAMLKKRGSRLIIVDPNEQPLGLFRRSGFIDLLGHENVFESMEEVIDHFLDDPRDDESPGNLGYL